jgi:hypothetical protein
MGDTRKPETVLWVRHGSGVSTKVELFSGLQFATEEFDTPTGEPIALNQRKRYYRIRIDGVWYPQGFKRLFNTTQCGELIKEAVFP